MNVTQTNHDEVSALLTVTLNKSDYKDKVEKQLINYAKNATVPGFRKGKVPLSMVKKQYEAGIAFEEINKQISDAINGYVNDNKLKLVGQPVPVPMNELDYNAEELSVGFEIGFEPDFSVDLTQFEAPHYKVESTDKEINQSIENMQKRFAEKDAQEKATKDSHIALSIAQVVEADAEGEHNHPPKQVVVAAEQKEAFGLMKSHKVGDVVKLTKTQLTENEVLAKDLNYNEHELGHIHHEELEATVVEIYKLNLAPLDQELFDKVYGEGNIKSEEELKERVKTELDEYFQQNADVQFVNKVLEDVSEKTEVKLPEEFLVKWLLFSNQNITSEEQAKEILEAEKSIIKNQIIEGKLFQDYDVKIEYADVLSQAEVLVNNQLAMYGIHNLPQEEVQKYAVEMLKQEEQVRQVSQEVAMNKLKEVILEKAKKNETKISHDEFLALLQK
jgi:trigger factor